MNIRLIAVVMLMGMIQIRGAAYRQQTLPELAKNVTAQVNDFRKSLKHVHEWNDVRGLRDSLAEYRDNLDAQRAMMFDPKIIRLFNTLDAEIVGKLRGLES